MGKRRDPIDPKLVKAIEKAAEAGFAWKAIGDKMGKPASSLRSTKAYREAYFRGLGKLRERIAKKVLELADGGDPKINAALMRRLNVFTLSPALPSMRDFESAKACLTEAQKAYLQGDLSEDQMSQIRANVKLFVDAIQMTEIIERLERVESQLDEAEGL